MIECPHISIANEHNFEKEVLKRSFSTPVFVDFWAGWCNPCKILTPILDTLAEEYCGRFHLAKIDTEKEKTLTKRFSIQNLPTVQIFKQGHVIDEFYGVLAESSIRTLIDNSQISDIDTQFQSALDALESNNEQDAKSILEDLLDKDSSHKNSLMLLAEIELKRGDNQKVDELLNHISIKNSSDAMTHKIQLLNCFSKEISDVKNIEELKQQVKISGDVNSQYKLACYFGLNKQYAEALESFINVMQQNPKFKNEGAKKSILGIFDILGGSGPLVNIYRVKMSRLLH